MATIAEVVEGLQILAKTAEIPRGLAEKGVTDGMQAFVEAEHEVLYGPNASPSEEDKVGLVKLGWFFDDERDGWCIDT